MLNNGANMDLWNKLAGTFNILEPKLSELYLMWKQYEQYGLAEGK